MERIGLCLKLDPEKDKEVLNVLNSVHKKQTFVKALILTHKHWVDDYNRKVDINKRICYDDIGY